MPRRILLATWGSYGDIYPYVGLGRALRARGDDVRLAAPAYYRTLIEKNGLAFAPAPPDVDPDDRSRLARVMDPVRGPEAIVREWLMPELRRSFEALEPLARDADLLVTHPVTFAGPVVAELRSIPWVSTVLAPMSFFSATDPPALPRMRWLAGLRHLGPWYGRAIVALARRATRTWAEPLHELRVAMGLPRGRHPLFEGQFSPLLTLAMFSPLLASAQRDWPSGVTQTGFVWYDDPEPLPSDLEAFLNAGDPPVVFTLGSSAIGAAGAARFYQESVVAIRHLGMRAVLLTGGLSGNDPDAAGSDVLVAPYAPHAPLFARAAVVVHHGGIGTTGQALRAGHPMLVVPHAHDQPDNAARISRLRVGRALDPARYTADRIARELTRLITDEYRTRAAAVGRQVAAERGAERAAAAIHAVMQGGLM